MEGSGNQERYDSFDEYSSNKHTYESIRSEIGDDYDLFPSEVIPSQTEDREHILKDCLRLRKYLLKFHNKEECQRKNCCAYINYFLNYGIRNSYKSKKYIFEFYTGYMNHDSNKDIKKLCGSEIIDMHEEKYNKTKKLYNVYHLYKIFTRNENQTPSCSDAISCARAYNNIITEYTKHNDKNFCKALKDFKSYFEKNEVISTKHCDDEFPNWFPLRDTCIHLQSQSRDTNLFSLQPDGHVEKEEASWGQSFSESQQTEREPEKQSSSPSSSVSTVPIAFFSSGIGILLILLSFYKFTPFGELLKLKMKKFKGASDHSDGEQYEMEQNYSEYEERNAEYNGYNISYNSI